jgi:hypothetical protein
METKVYKVEEKKKLVVEPQEFLKALGIEFRGKIKRIYASLSTGNYGDDAGKVTIEIETETEDKLLQLDYTGEIIDAEKLR